MTTSAARYKVTRADYVRSTVSLLILFVMAVMAVPSAMADEGNEPNGRVFQIYIQFGDAGQIGEMSRRLVSGREVTNTEALQIVEFISHELSTHSGHPLVATSVGKSGRFLVTLDRRYTTDQLDAERAKRILEELTDISAIPIVDSDVLEQARIEREPPFDPLVRCGRIKHTCGISVFEQHSASCGANEGCCLLPPVLGRRLAQCTRDTLQCNDECKSRCGDTFLSGASPEFVAICIDRCRAGASYRDAPFVCETRPWARLFQFE